MRTHFLIHSAGGAAPSVPDGSGGTRARDAAAAEARQRAATQAAAYRPRRARPARQVSHAEFGHTRLTIAVAECEAEPLRLALFLRLEHRLASLVLTPHVCVGKSQAWAALDVAFERNAIEDVLEVVKENASTRRASAGLR
jgi:hypothetical protein